MGKSKAAPERVIAGPEAPGRAALLRGSGRRVGAPPGRGGAQPSNQKLQNRGEWLKPRDVSTRSAISQLFGERHPATHERAAAARHFPIRLDVEHRLGDEEVLRGAGDPAFGA